MLKNIVAGIEKVEICLLVVLILLKLQVVGMLKLVFVKLIYSLYQPLMVFNSLYCCL